MNITCYPSVVCLANITDAPIETLESFLSKDEYERKQCFRQTLDSQRYTLAHYLKRYVLSLFVGCLPAELKFDKDVYGKPFCVGHPSLYFNLSHSQNWVAIAVSRLSPVGLDIEFWREVDVDKILEKISSSEQLERYQIIEDRNALFLRVWTQKEAVSKAYGQGIRCGLTNIPCTGGLGQHQLSCFGHNYYVYSEQMEEDGVLSFASSNSQLPAIIRLGIHAECNEKGDRVVVFNCKR